MTLGSYRGGHAWRHVNEWLQLQFHSIQGSGGPWRIAVDWLLFPEISLHFPWIGWGGVSENDFTGFLLHNFWKKDWILFFFHRDPIPNSENCCISSFGGLSCVFIIRNAIDVKFKKKFCFLGSCLTSLSLSSLSSHKPWTSVTDLVRCLTVTCFFHLMPIYSGLGNKILFKEIPGNFNGKVKMMSESSEILFYWSAGYCPCKLLCVLLSSALFPEGPSQTLSSHITWSVSGAWLKCEYSGCVTGASVSMYME